MKESDSKGWDAYEGGVWKDKGPPGHLEGQAPSRAQVLPERADRHEEEPHGEAPEPEGHEDGDDLDDVDAVLCAEEVWREDDVGFGAQLCCDLR